MVLDYGIPLALITTLKRGPSLDQVNGTWFLWSVGSESVAVAAASLARVTPGHALAVLAVVCWAVGLMQYVAPARHRDVRRPVGVLRLADPAPAGSGRLAARAAPYPAALRARLVEPRLPGRHVCGHHA
nr:hypothetical protein [Streptomyces puniciscabiei]